MKNWVVSGILRGVRYYPGAEDFIQKNIENHQRGLLYDDLSFIFEPDNKYDRNAIKIIASKTQLKIGYVDQDTARLIALLAPTWITGWFDDVSPDYVTLGISVTSSLPDEDAHDLLYAPDRFIERHYPQYANMAFGADCPTFSQFDYALNLGINPNKKTFKNISSAIDKANNCKRERKPSPVPDEHRLILYGYLCNNSPASREEISLIHYSHGELTRSPITKNEVEQIINLLEDPDFKIECPYCNHKVPNEDLCENCLRSFRKLRIPILWNENGPYLGTRYLKQENSRPYKTNNHFKSLDPYKTENFCKSSEEELTPNDILIGCGCIFVILILLIIFLNVLDKILF